MHYQEWKTFKDQALLFKRIPPYFHFRVGNTLVGRFQELFLLESERDLSEIIASLLFQKSQGRIPNNMYCLLEGIWQGICELVERD